jgi:hypothetical protein
MHCGERGAVGRFEAESHPTASICGGHDRALDLALEQSEEVRHVVLDDLVLLRFFRVDHFTWPPRSLLNEFYAAFPGFAVAELAAHLAMIVGYSVFVGLVPNLLFYAGNTTATARSAGLILLLEPVIATLTSHWIWHDRLPILFFVGVALILFAGVPVTYLVPRVRTQVRPAVGEMPGQAPAAVPS